MGGSKHRGPMRGFYVSTSCHPLDTNDDTSFKASPISPVSPLSPQRQVNMHFPLIANLLPSLLSLSSPQPDPSRSLPISPRTLTFQPIHAYTHTTFNSSTRPSLLLHNATTPTSYLNIPDLGSLQSLDEDNAYLIDNPAPHIASSPLTIRTTPIIVRRPRIRPPSILSWALSARNERYTSGNTSDNWLAPDYADVDGDWEDVEVMGPDVTDRQTLLALAKISSNAYVTPDGGEWWPVEGLNQTLPFGWEADSDGLRGHVVSRALLFVKHR